MVANALAGCQTKDTLTLEIKIANDLFRKKGERIIVMELGPLPLLFDDVHAILPRFGHSPLL